MTAQPRLRRGPAVRDGAWLAPDVLLAVADFESGPKADASVSATVDGSSIPAEARSQWLPPSEDETVQGAIFTVRVELPARDEGPIELAFASGASTASWGAASASALGVDLRTLAREHLAGLDTDTRARILAFLLVSAGALDSSVDPHRLSQSLALLRDALREPRPRAGLGAEAPHSLRIDDLFRIDERSFLVHGWVRDEQAPVARLTAVSPEGARVEMLDRMAPVRRPDLDKPLVPSNGSAKLPFVCSLAPDLPSRLGTGWIFELENAAGAVVEAEGPEPVEDPIAAREAIASLLEREHAPTSRVAEHVLPAVARLQERLASTVEIERVDRFGEAPRTPVVSIVVPLYKRVDLLQHQLAQFAVDPEVSGADLIYVLDSPELAESTLADAARLFELYRVPFRIATLSRNGGFAVANNQGASLASGRLLLLLNSDVLPATPGWLGRMASFHDSTARIGALGPKLLFEDDSLQHAGLYFRRPAAWAAWENAHYFKGLHHDLPAANVPRRVPAVTAACLMIKRQLYEEVGGLRSIYIQGDYEDSDLCLRLAEAGCECWYQPDVVLYHLEGRSYATATRQANARYNTWLHTSLWGPQIERLMSEEERAQRAGSSPTA
jgi:GT2 family glycosyltransferase